MFRKNKKATEKATEKAVEFKVGNNVTIQSGVLKDKSAQVIEVRTEKLGNTTIVALKVRVGVRFFWLPAGNVRREEQL